MTSNDDLDKLFNYIQKLEKRLRALETKDAVIVKGYLETKQPKPLNISEEQLINLYHDVPQVLSEYIVEASLTADSYRQKTKEKIILEQTVRGNYWVVLLEEKEEKKYYLFPNGNIKLRLYRLKKIDYLFNITGPKIVDCREFTVLKPALISIYPSGKQWQLQKKGYLNLGKYDAKTQLFSDLEKITNNQEKIPDSLEKLFNLLEKINQNKFDIKAEIQSLRNRLIKLEPEYSELVNLYQNEPQHFMNLAQGSQQVKITQKTMNTLLQGQFNDVNFEFSRHGEYLIKKINQCEYLFPNPDMIFDRMTLSIVHQAKLFICQGEFPIAVMGKDIQIQKPAKVRPRDYIWIVVEAGEIIF